MRNDLTDRVPPTFIGMILESFRATDERREPSDVAFEALTALSDLVREVGSLGSQVSPEADERKIVSDKALDLVFCAVGFLHRLAGAVTEKQLLAAINEGHAENGGKFTDLLFRGWRHHHPSPERDPKREVLNIVKQFGPLCDASPRPRVINTPQAVRSVAWIVLRCLHLMAWADPDITDSGMIRRASARIDNLTEGTGPFRIY